MSTEINTLNAFKSFGVINFRIHTETGDKTEEENDEVPKKGCLHAEGSQETTAIFIRNRVYSLEASETRLEYLFLNLTWNAKRMH